jgi:PKD repeat protein
MRAFKPVMPASSSFRRASVAAALAASCAIAWTAPASANHPQPARNIANLPYQPIGEFAHGTDIPEPDAAQAFFTPKMNGRRYDGPTGTYNAYDTNVFETLMLPFRAAGDTTTNDPYGNGGDTRHGFCKQEPDQADQRPGNSLLAAGVCPNHALEYAAYYEDTMQNILGDFGVKMHRYRFDVPQPATPVLDNTLGGAAYNLAAVVPGADHPEETVIIGAHYDQTNDGPASTWDSAEGHAQIIRVAKQMSDYWKATGTRPSATVKFIPWAGEEAGTLGSRDYAENNIVPGEENKVRGYWNTDPCAGGYPAYRNGVIGDRIPVGIQLARPTEVPDEFAKLRPRITEFNGKAEQVVEDFFNKVDDTVKTGPAGGVAAPRPIFVSKAEAASEGSGTSDINTDQGVKLGDSRPVLFSSDWANFLNKGIPFFNPGPEVTGPSDENEPNTPDGAATFHTPNDNQVTMNRYTGQTLSVGNNAVAAEGWAKGMEMCASLLSWGMLRSDQGGAQTAATDVVAYYEALPNEAIARGPVTFDAGGSYQYANAGTHTYVPDSQLEYTWEFGDNTTATGKVVEHAYDVAGTYTSKLTVRNTVTNATDTMTVPITVKGATLTGPKLSAPAEDVDGNFDIGWEFDEKAKPDLRRYLVEEAPDVRRVFSDPAEKLDSWTASEPTAPEVTKWTTSDKGGGVRGNQKKSGERSFYSGVPRSEHTPGQGPNSGIAKLTLKQSFQVAKDAELSYWSSYVNDLNDTGLVEAAIDTGDGDDALDWSVVDRVTTTDFYNVPNDDAGYPTVFENRRVDLGAFAGQKIKLRFVYQLGAAQYVNVTRAGWYVDDLSVDSGTFKSVGETRAKTMKIGPRQKGTYAYRVRAIYGDTATLPSNYAQTRVTVGTDPAAGGTGTGNPPAGPPASRCSVDNGFRSLKVQRRGRGLRFTFAKSVSGKVRVDIFRYVKGRKISRKTVKSFRNRTKSFTWNGRGKGVRNGSYYARVEVPTAGKPDVRYFALVRSRGRFKLRSAFVGRPTCGPLRQFRLGQLVFGGNRREGLRVVYEVADAGTVRVELLRGKRVVKRANRRIARPGPYATVFGAKGLRRGKYRVRITAVLGGRRVVSTLTAYRI